MKTLIDGAIHLCEHGEAIQQSRSSGEDCRGGVRPEAAEAHWYALNTYPRHEKRVHQELGLRAIECFLPLYEAARRWKNGCNVRVELPLFPGYISVRIDPRHRFKALSLLGAVSFVGSANGPWQLSDAEIVSLRDRLQSCNFEPHAYLAVGQKVRIKSGPLADLTGFLVRQSGGLRVVLSLDLIQRAASVEVDAVDVEALGPAASGFDL